MNPGYLSFVLITCMVILLISGWRVEMVGTIARWRVTLFIGLWFILMPFIWHVTPDLTIHFNVVLIAALIVGVCLTINSRAQLIQLILMAIFLSFWHGYLMYTYRWSPIHIIHPIVDVAAGESIIAGFIIRNPLHQMFVLAIAVLAGMLFDQALSGAAHITIGAIAFWDQLLLVVFMTRIVALLAQWSRNKLFSK
jgi:hypothetical protein